MSNQYTNNQIDKLANACDEAVDLVRKLSNSVDAIKAQENDLAVDICNLRYKANAGHEVLPLSNSLGVFGSSQEGKSYLVSVLAATSADIELTANWSGHDILFMTHVNPKGGNREATGLVTRFTEHMSANVEGYPVNIKVMNEIEFVKVLVNSYFADIEVTPDYMAERDSLFTDINKTKAFFADLESAQYKLATNEESYVKPHHLIELAEYVNTHAKDSILKNSDYGSKCYFWSQARKIVPKLNLEGRKKFYGTLWFDLPVFKKIFATISPYFEKLKGIQKAYLPVNAVVDFNEDGSICDKKIGSIADVKVLQSIFKGDDQEFINVALDDKAQDVVSIPFSAIVCLTLEFEFPAAKNRKSGDFDILDFPGARSRGGNIISVWKNEIKDDADHNPYDFIVRGKVGYLIEHFVKRHEIDILLICRSAFKQDEVEETSNYITMWVDENIGKTQNEREKYLKENNQVNPLVATFTMFDEVCERDVPSPGSQPKQNSDISGTISKQLERLKKPEWFDNFANGKTFDQFFFVRKANLDKTKLFELDSTGNNKEIRLLDTDNVKYGLDVYRREIIKDPYMKCVYEFNKYNADGHPEDTPVINQVLIPNDGGVSYLSEFLRKTFSQNFTQSKKHFYEMIKTSEENVRDMLSKYAQRSGQKAEELARKKALDNIKKLKECDKLAHTLSDMRHFIEIDEQMAKKDYLDNFANTSEIKNSPRFAQALTKMRNDNLDSLYNGPFFATMFSNLMSAWTKTAQDTVEAYSEEEKMKDFIFFLDESNQLIRSESALKSKFKDLIQYFSGELKKAYDAYGVQNVVIEALSSQESSTSKKDEICDEQCARALQIISDFNTYLSLTTEDMESLTRSFTDSDTEKRPLFNEDVRIDIKNGEYTPDITDAMAKTTSEHFYNDYFSALLKAICKMNITAENPYKIDSEDNNKLCDILNQMDEVFMNKETN